ncbi:hypothetical protein WJX75_004534 [Coccomyxa subellipsoidea]|uniref:Uncharacterized protein n=1 Tax=Coccomyxa subellipsoidea TaxID=248742 RepID=A0ABR2YAI8_9CHLO
MTNTEQDTQGPTGAQELPDNGEMAVALCFGESAAQLQLTKGGIRAISLDTTAAIWKTLVQKMAFFLDKVEQLVAGRRTLFGEMGTLTAEWHCLWAQLKKITDIQEVTDGAVISFVAVADLTKELRANVHALNICRHNYLCNAFTRVLKHVQVARFFVALYPMGRDLPSLLTLLAMQANGPSSSEAPCMVKTWAGC